MLPLFSGGYVSNSLAIMTDAVHMLADVLGILFSLLALWLSTKPPSKKFTFGLHRLGECPTLDCDSDFCLPLAPTLLTHIWDKMSSVHTGEVAPIAPGTRGCFWQIGQKCYSLHNQRVCVVFVAPEVVSAVVNVALIYILTAILVYEAVQRTVHQEFDIDGDVMLITAAVGVAVNLM